MATRKAVVIDPHGYTGGSWAWGAGSLTPTLVNPKQVYRAWEANRTAATAPRGTGTFLFVSGHSVLETVDEGVTFRVLVQNLASAASGRGATPGSAVVQHSPLMVIPSCDER